MSKSIKPEQPQTGNAILAGIAGGAVFLVFLFVLKLNLLLSAAVAVGGYVAFILITRPQPKPNDLIVGVSGITREMFDETIKQGEAGYKELRWYTEQIKERAIKDKGLKLCDLVQRIIQDVKEDPKDVKAAQKFFSYYLGTALKIIKEYVDLSAKNITNLEIERIKLNVGKTLDMLIGAFEKQLAKLLEDNLLDLDTEIQVLQRSLKMEGLGDLEDELERK